MDTALVLYTSLSTILAEHCEVYSLFLGYDGRYCTGEGNATWFMPAHHCRATCLESIICKAYNYNVTDGTCTSFTSPCPQAISDPIMEFAVFTHIPYEDCYEWVLYSSGDTLDERMISTDDPRYTICRIHDSGNDVVCYFTTFFPNCYASSGGSPFNSIDRGYPCERFRVKEGCTSFWVPYIAHDPIPPRAVIAGHMVNGDRVYVTKFDYHGPPVLSLSGHYVEGAENTITASGGAARYSNTMMMMVIL